MLFRSYIRRCLEKQGVQNLNTEGEEKGKARIYDNPTTFKTKDGKYISLNCSSQWQTLLVPHSVLQYSHYQWTRVSTLVKPIYYFCSTLSKWLSEPYLCFHFGGFLKLLFILPRVSFTRYYYLFSMRAISILTNLLVRYFSNFNMYAHHLRTL